VRAGIEYKNYNTRWVSNIELRLTLNSVPFTKDAMNVTCGFDTRNSTKAYTTLMTSIFSLLLFCVSENI